MAYPKGTNSANFNNCAVWNSMAGNVTSVGTNGGPSAYGTYDQAGNVNEWVNTFSVLGGSYASSTGDLGLIASPRQLTSSSSLPTLGFRIVGTDYTNIFVSFSGPSSFSPGTSINRSFSIINNEAFDVSLNLSSSFSKNIVSTSWNAIYTSGSTGPSSGSGSPSGNITIKANSSVLFNLSSSVSSLTKSSAILNISISLADISLPPLRESSFSSTIPVRFAFAPNPLNYSSLFGSFSSNWDGISPNEFISIDNPNNSADFNWGTGLGSVSYTYLMTKYEVTNIEYCHFLNSIDPDGINPQGIYDTNMGSQSLGGINFTSSAASGAKYSLKPRMGNKPVNFVSWWSAARYCNWLHNGGIQYTSTDSTSSAPQNTGSYSLGTNTSGSTVSANSGASFTLPTTNEWIKAAYHNGALNNYYRYSTQTSSAPASVSANIVSGNGISTIENNTANLNNAASWDPINGNQFQTRVGPTTVGTNGVASYYGLFDMNGNVEEITQSENSSFYRSRGGAYNTSSSFIGLQSANSYDSNRSSDFKSSSIGFRVRSRITGDLSISSVANKANYDQNEDTIITLTINNQSAYSMENTGLVVSLFGPTFQNISWTATYQEDSSGPLSGSSGSINTNINIGINETIIFTFTVRTTPASIDVIGFYASITPPSFFADSNLNNNSTLLNIPVKPADLSVSITGPTTYAQGVASDYVMTVDNIGTTYLSAGIYTSLFGIDIDSCTATYSLATGALVGTTFLPQITEIYPGGRVIYNIKSVPPANKIDNRVLTVWANTTLSVTDSNLANNTGVITSVIIPTDLKIDILSNDYYTQNIMTTGSIVITNSGQYSPSGSLNVLFSGVPLSNITWSGIYSTNSTGPLSGTGNIISTSGLFLANNGSATYNFTYLPPSGNMLPISCSASVGTRNPLSDSNTSNNTDTFSWALSPTDISIVGSGGSRLYYVNELSIDYSFTVINNSPNNIPNINVSIPSAQGVNSTRWAATYINGSGLTLGSGSINTNIYLASGGFARYVFDGIAAANIVSSIEPTGSISLPNIAGLTDPNLSNNTASISIPHSLLIQDVIYSSNTCDNNGYVSITVDGGVPPFRYTLGSLFANSSERTYKFTGLSPGIYNVVVIDSTNYVASYGEDLTIEDSTISFSVNNIYSPTLLDSFAKLDFTISGEGPFSLIFTNTSTEETIEIPAFETKYLADITDDEYTYIIDDKITPGTYSLRIMGNEGCILTETIIVPNITPISVAVSSSPDDPITVNTPLISLDIFDTLLIPYKHILNNSNVWNLIKAYNIKDNIYLWINDERYEFRVVRTMLDKYCLNENKIEILKLGNSYEDWYFYLYIAPSINLTFNPELINAKIRLGTSDGSNMHDVILGLSEDGNLEQNLPSLIKGSIIVDGVSFPDIVNGSSAHISVGVDDLGLATNDFELLNIKKTQFARMYSASVVTAINFLENFNVLNEYVSLNQTSCNTKAQDYEYLVTIKRLLTTINNFNNLNTIYLFNNNNTTHTGQINCFPTIHTPMVTDKGSIDNEYTIEYFTFNTEDDHVHKFIVNNQHLKNVSVINGIDSRYVIARVFDNYNNIPRSIIYDNITIPYDTHFIKSKQIIQQVNPQILHDFIYGDILIFVPKVAEEDLPNPSPVPPTIPVIPTPTPTIPTVEVSKDTTNTSSLQLTILPQNTKCIIYGPQQYEHVFAGNIKFTNIIPGVYRIIGETTDLKNKNLYQNEYRIIINKNMALSQTIEFFSYANQIFISKEDH